MKLLHSYVPLLLALVAGIICYDASAGIHIVCAIPIAFLFFYRKFFLLVLGIVCSFEAGMWSHQFRENQIIQLEKNISTYLDQKITLEGRVVSHPVPARGKFSYILMTDKLILERGEFYQNFRIQITSKSFQSPEKGDRISLTTKLFTPKTLQNFQKIKNIQGYALVYGNKNWKRIQTANAFTTQVRTKIFDAAKTHLSATSYGYFRAMVFGDQAFLSQRVMDRLKETGLLHLFVISGSHIAFVWMIGLGVFRFMLSWIRFFHRRKNFCIWVDAASILSVLVFLELINPPISTFRAVGSMVLFLLLKLMKRNQFPIWNLGVVFMVTILFNPLYLFDVSTQLTFASVAGLICGYNLYKRWSSNIEEPHRLGFVYKAAAASLGAGLFTFPILYYHFGTFYILSFAYNLILGTTFGALISFLAVASLVWALIPWEFLQALMFGILDYLFLLFEKIIFWNPDFGMPYASGLDLAGISGGYGLIGVGAFGMAFIIARHFFKKSTYL